MTERKGFVHTHVHTEFSMLDGAARIGDIVAAAVADGAVALGSTDHGNMYAVPDLYKECEKQGIKSLIGTEAYMAEESRYERPETKGSSDDDSGGEDASGKKINYHLTLLAENNVGYKNLIQLSSRAYLEGFYRKPRIDWDLLEQYSEGVIATTGCLGGLVLQALMNHDPNQARLVAGRLQDIFGKDNLFVELQDHGIAEQKQTMTGLLDLAAFLDAPLLATNDSHYVHKEDAAAHDTLLCVQTKALRSDKDRFKFDGHEHYLKTAQEMRSLFSEHPDSCDNTLWIAERCDVKLDFKSMHLPKFPIPEDYIDDSQYLAELVLQGAVDRWGAKYNDEVLSRLAYELKTIGDMGFSSYFLIVWDLIKHAKESGIRIGPGRGSAAGCAVAYALGITDLDPIKYDLLFERFLNPSRISMPDIDIDMDTRYRDELIRYTTDKYGSDHVAQIVTFSKIKARSAVRDTARVLEKPYALGDKIAKALPPSIMGHNIPLAACFELKKGEEAGYSQSGEIRDLYASDPEVREIVDIALGLEDLRRQDGIHAAAVVIGDAPLTEYLPVQQKPLKATNKKKHVTVMGPVTTQYEMHAVDELGLLKMDYLGLRNLDVISECVAILAREGITVDIDNPPLDDQKTFDMLQQGDTIGVFQLESAPMQELVKRLKPTSFDDIAALVALYRPGPMAANMHNDYADRKNGVQGVLLFHEDAAEILADTFGLPIYQEQIMQLAQKFAGYSLAEADNLRKAMGKKIRELMAKEYDKFVDGCVAQGYTEELGKSLFAMVEKFSDYGFNKSHAYGYGFIAYQTAYLKANYLLEYMAALCSSVDKVERIGFFLAEARKRGLKVNIPDVNKSEINFTAVDGEILVGLGAIAGIGSALGAKIVEARKSGPFTDVWDFARRMVVNGFNRASFSAMIDAGALDSFGMPRLGLSGSTDTILTAARKDNKRNAGGTMQLFDVAQEIEIPDYEYTPEEKLRLEKKLLGLYVTGHPLDAVPDWVAENSTGNMDDVETWDSDKFITIAGIVTDLQEIRTRKGDKMATMLLEDIHGRRKVTIFSKTWMKMCGTLPPGDFLAAVRCRVTTDSRDERNLICMAIEPKFVEPVFEDDTDFRIYLPQGFQSDERFIAKLRGLTLGHRGTTTVTLYLSRKAKMRLPPEHRVRVTPELIEAFKALFKEFKA